jgi:hypothetical protein
MRDYGLPVSVALHVLVLASAILVLPAAEPFAPQEESLPVEIVTPDQLAAMTKGEKTAKPADKPAIKVDKVAEAKLDEDPTPAVKREAVSAPPPPQPKAPDPVPEPPKPVARPDPPKPEPAKLPDPPKPPEPPKPEVAKVEPKPQQKPDADKLDELALKALQDQPKPDKKAEAKPEKPPEPPQKVAEAKPADKPADKPAKPVASEAKHLDLSKIAALISKEAPARAARTDTEAAATSSLGTSRGEAPKLSLSQNMAIKGAIRDQVRPCWSSPSYAANAKDLSVLINVELNQDGTLAADPEIVKYPANASGVAAAGAAIRAIKRCVTAQAPLKLPPNLYASWRELEINFDPSEMAGG